MRKFLRALLVALVLAVSSPTPVSGSTGVVSLILPLQYQSQLSEPAPEYWEDGLTPYCAVASSFMILRSFGVQVAGLEQNFYLGRKGNITPDPGLDPRGVSYLLQKYGGQGTIHSYWDQGAMLDDLVGRLNWGSPVLIFGQAGNHAMVAYGYEAVPGGEITAIYVADPLGFMGRVDLARFLNWYEWMGSPFTAPGEDWRGSWTFVSFRDFR